jgi:hypothetical protein
LLRKRRESKGRTPEAGDDPETKARVQDEAEGSADF